MFPGERKELGLINTENLSMKMTYLDYVQKKKSDKYKIYVPKVVCKSCNNSIPGDSPKIVVRECHQCQDTYSSL